MKIFLLLFITCIIFFSLDANVFSAEPCPNNVCDTAIGPINLSSPTGFVTQIFTIVLTIAGMSAVLLIIYGGYIYMISRGDPEKIKHGKEVITAAIIGLLFIIFSLVILQVITGDILRIPGFGGAELREVEGGTTGEPFVGDPVVQP